MRTILKYSEYRGSSLIFGPPSSEGADKGADKGADEGADAVRSTSDASARSSSGFVVVVVGGGGGVASRASVGGGALVSVSLVDGAASNPSTLREKTRGATGRVGQSRFGSSDGWRRLPPTNATPEETSRARGESRIARRGVERGTRGASLGLAC